MKLTTNKIYHAPQIRVIELNEDICAGSVPTVTVNPGEEANESEGLAKENAWSDFED